MGMCKGCSEVFSALEMKDGMCKSCLENGIPVAKEEKRKKNEGISLLGAFIIVGIIGILGSFIFSPEYKPESKEDKIAREKEILIQKKKEERIRKDKECTSKISGFATAIGYLKTKLKYPDDSEIDVPYIHNIDNSCQHVMKGKLKVKNAFGVFTQYNYKVVVIYDKETDMWKGRVADIYIP